MAKRFFYGWVIVAVSSVGLFAATATAPPVFTLFIQPLEQEFGWSRTAIAGAVSLGTAATALVLPPLGRFLDKYGARLAVTVAGLLTGASLLSLAWVGNLWGFYLLFGLGRLLDQGVLSIACTVAVSNWFIRQRGRAQAIINAGRSLGATLLPLMAYFVLRHWGWRAAWMAMGALIWVILVPPAAIFMRRRPEDMGLRPDGDGAGSPDPPPAGLDMEPTWSLGKAVRTRALWLITAALFIRGMAAPGVGVHLVPYLLGQGVAPTTAATANSLSAAALGVGGLAWGVLAEKRRVGYLLSASLALLSASVALLLVADDAPTALAYALIAGGALGGTFTLEAVVWADYFGRRSLGTIQGFTMPFYFVGTALGPLLAGLSYDLGGSYQAAFVGFVGAYALAALMVLLAKPPRAPAAA